MCLHARQGSVVVRRRCRHRRLSLPSSSPSIVIAVVVIPHIRPAMMLLAVCVQAVPEERLEHLALMPNLSLRFGTTDNQSGDWVQVGVFGLGGECLAH